MDREDTRTKSAESFIYHRPHSGPFQDFNEITVYRGDLIVTNSYNADANSGELTLRMRDGEAFTLCQWKRCLYVNYRTRFARHASFKKISLWPTLAHEYKYDEGLHFENHYRDPVYHELLASLVPQDMSLSNDDDHTHPPNYEWIWGDKMSLWYAPREWLHHFVNLPMDQGRHILDAHVSRVEELVLAALVRDGEITEMTAQQRREGGAWPTGVNFPQRCAEASEASREELELQMLNHRAMVVEWGTQGQRYMHACCREAEDKWRREDEDRLHSTSEWRVPAPREKLFFNCHRGDASIELRNESVSQWPLHTITLDIGQSHIYRVAQ